MAKKVGLLGILFLVLKKGWIVIVVGGAAAWRWLSGLFGGKKGGDFSSSARPAYDIGGLGDDPAAAEVSSDAPGTPGAGDDDPKP